MSYVTDFENLDLERLHYTINSRLLHTDRPRGLGRTMAFIALMVGEAENGDFGNTYLYVGENIVVTKEVAHSVKQILLNRHFDVTSRQSGTRTTLFVGDADHLVKTFRFIPATGIDREDVCGWVFDDIFVDVSSEPFYQVHPEVWEIVYSRRRDRYNNKYLKEE